jgi:hypothetical protein
MISENETSTSTIARALWSAAGGESDFLTNLEIMGTGDLPSVFAVSDLANCGHRYRWFGNRVTDRDTVGSRPKADR